MMLASPDNQTIFAALNLGHYGTKLHRSDDGGSTWTELQTQRFPTVEGGDKGAKTAAVTAIWSMEWAGKEKSEALWIGTAPAALFSSTDNGKSWVLNEPLWNLPSRAKWMGGGTVDTALHSICVDPRTSGRVAVAVFFGGVTLFRGWRQELARCRSRPKGRVLAARSAIRSRRSRCAPNGAMPRQS